MAGGIGTRLWPLSRKSVPKQFQKLIGNKTLLQQTFSRIKRVIPEERIWVVTGESYKDLVSEQLPAISTKHIITEPEGRNTAAATALSTLKILEEDPDAVLFGLIPADHYIGKPEVFYSVAKTALSFIEKHPEYVTTIGIEPTEASTGLGYIKIGDAIDGANSKQVFKVKSFHEKPDQRKANNFLSSGNYLWNGGYYLFKGRKMIEYYEELSPEIIKAVEKYIAAPSAALYKKIPSEPIDKAISEKLTNLAVIPAEMQWSDIGSWASLHDVLSSRGKPSSIISGNHIGSSSDNNLILGNGKLIVTVGLKDVVVVDTDDVVMICNKESAHEVKDIVEELQKQGKGKFL